MAGAGRFVDLRNGIHPRMSWDATLRLNFGPPMDKTLQELSPSFELVHEVWNNIVAIYQQ